MATRIFSSDDADLEVFYKELAAHDLQPLWQLQGLLTKEPKTRAVPWVWRFEELGRLAARSGELVGIDRGGDRRVLACANPGLNGEPYAVGSLWAAVQYLQPGETAPAHRHTPGALRFVLEGDSVWTILGGDPIHMAAGDLIITPSWTFHEHHNSGSASMMWLDVLDLPMVQALDAIFYQDGPSEDVEITTPPRSLSEQRFGGGPGLVPATPGGPTSNGSRLLAYRWADTDRALRSQLDAGEALAHLRYVDPLSGRDVMPTMRCEIMRLPAGTTGPARRQTGGRIATVLHGRATVEVGDDVFDNVGPGDILAIPSWSRLQITAQQELDLFFTTDAPVLEALGLMRDEAVV